MKITSSCSLQYKFLYMKYLLLWLIFAFALDLYTLTHSFGETGGNSSFS